MNVITVWSESGGVGKTTTTLNIAAALSEKEQDVLICDLDPQPASLTDYTGHLENITNDDNTLTDALLNRDVSLSDIIIEDGYYDIVPSASSLANIESIIHSEGISMGEFLLQSELEHITDQYDFVILDPPATLNILVDNALIASQDVLIPMEMTDKGKRSVNAVQDTVTSLENQIQRARPDFTINIKGIIPSKTENTRMNSEIKTELQEELSIPIFETEIPNYDVLNKAWQLNMNIYEYNDNKSLQDYEEKILESYDAISEQILK